MAKVLPYSKQESSVFKEGFLFPKHWEVEAAHFAFDEVRDGTHDSPKPVESGVRLITSKNLKSGYIDFSEATLISELDHQEIKKRSEVKNGDLLFSMIGTIGNIAIVNSDMDFSIKNVGLFRSRPLSLIPKFSMYWLMTNTFQKYLDNLKRGGNQKFVSLGILRASPIPLPPLAEQKEIATLLDNLLAQVDTLKTRLDAIPNILKHFRQSVLAAAVSGKLTEEWRNNSDFIWKQVSLADVALGFSYGTSSKSSKEGKTPVLRMGNIQNGNLIWDDLVYTSDTNEIKKYNLIKGDVLFNRTNSLELVGKTAIYRGEYPAIYAGYLICVRCKSALDPEFLNISLNSLYAKAYCRAVKSDGVSQSNINAKKLAAYSFYLPPIEEQTEIVR
ncbi:MAG: restriction endonuclease subunit S [Thiolinea sp.]